MESDRARIGVKVRALRTQRGLSQAELARRLEMSQARLSLIESGKASLTAEQFLVVLGIFNVPVADFSRKRGSELQNALSRLGAFQLQEDSDALPSERLEKVTDVVRETLVDAESPRLVTALAPVIVRNVDAISWGALTHDLRALGLARRFQWLVENVLEAIKRASTDVAASPDWRRAYRRAETVLDGVRERMETEELLRALPPDILDRGIRSQKTRDEVSATASEISRRWHVVTSIQTADFVDALRGAHVRRS